MKQRRWPLVFSTCPNLRLLRPSQSAWQTQRGLVPLSNRNSRLQTGFLRDSTEVRNPIKTSVEQASAHQTGSAPVWIPRNGKDSNGIPYIVITRTECLRSFPLNVTTEENPEVLETPCLFCSNTVKYIIDFSLSVFSPTKVKAAPVISRKDTAAKSSPNSCRPN
jgi:hypothetical protein